MVTYVPHIVAVDVDQIPDRNDPFDTAKSIIHCLYSFEFGKSQDGKKRQVILKAETNRYLLTEFSIPEFLKACSKGRPPKSTQPKPDKPAHKHTPLDAAVDGPCFYVIQLDPDCDWAFSQNQKAFEQKRNGGHGPNDNANLLHVDPDNPGRTQKDQYSTKECKLCYFEVRERRDKEARQFLCNVVLIVEEKSGSDILKHLFEIGVDPDVPNTGAAFP